MTFFQRFFGAGPLGLLWSCLLFVVFLMIERYALQPCPIISVEGWRFAVVALLLLLTLLSVGWALHSLPMRQRGLNLISKGAYKYVRHPLYAAFINFFAFAVAVYINHCVMLLWVLALRPLWHRVMKKEERLMIKQFPKAYPLYCSKVGRFVPKTFISRFCRIS